MDLGVPTRPRPLPEAARRLISERILSLDEEFPVEFAAGDRWSPTPWPVGIPERFGAGSRSEGL